MYDVGIQVMQGHDLFESDINMLILKAKSNSDHTHSCKGQNINVQSLQK